MMKSIILNRYIHVYCCVKDITKMVGVLLNLAFCGLMIETALCSPYSRLAGSSSSSNGLYNNNDNGFYDIPMEEDVQNQLINEETKLLQDLLVSDLLEDLKEVGAAGKV